MSEISEIEIKAMTKEQNYLRGYEDGKSNVLGKIRAEIKPKCDCINSLASVLPYTAHREIQELLCEIMDLCKAEGGTQHETDS